MLYLIRHAKSSWDDPSLQDFDRPLNGRGQKDAPKMGKRLKKRGIVPELMISSTAVRAATTALAIADKLHYARENILMRDELYHAEPSAILNVVQQTDEAVNTLFVFGHNPGLTDFANELCKKDIDNIVTCGVYALALDVNGWEALRLHKQAKLLFYDFPKKNQ